jgi:peptide/nickel transport system substrate-binding protein
MRALLRTLLLTGLLASTAACGDRPARPGPGGEQPVRGGTLVIGGPSDLREANGLVANEKYTQEVNRYLLFLPLLHYSPGLEYEPALASSWEPLGDTAVVFHLRPDVRWGDGVPTRARDVVFTYRRVLDPASAYPNGEYFAAWTAVDEVDSLTVRARFSSHNEPLAGVPFLPIMPAHLLDSISPARMAQAAFNHRPIGNGPFRFVEYRANDRWVFEANPEYAPSLGGPPLLERIVWRVIPDATAQATELQTGTLHLALANDAQQFARLDSLPDIRGIVKPSRQYGVIGWNHRRPPLGDPRVRRALSYAIDRGEILRTLRAGYGQLAVGPIGPYHWAFDTTVAPLPFNPDSARALLAQAGIADRNGDGKLELADGRPFTIELEFPGASVANRDMAQVIDANLEELGVNLEQRSVDYNAMIQRVISPQRDFDAFITAFENDFRINLRDLFHSGAGQGPYQFAGYRNARVDTLIDLTSRAQPREQARPLYSELQRIIRDEQPWAFLYYAPELVLVSEQARDVEMDVRGVLVNAPRWWLRGGGAAGAPAARGDSAGRSPGPGPAPRQ